LDYGDPDVDSTVGTSGGAYAIARWLKEVGWGRLLYDEYFDSPMTGKDRGIAEMEGWILGMM
jgi:hypothetical protein